MPMFGHLFFICTCCVTGINTLVSHILEANIFTHAFQVNAFVRVCFVADLAALRAGREREIRFKCSEKLVDLVLKCPNRFARR